MGLMEKPPLFLVIERLLFVIELDQDILRQALAEDQEDITTVVRSSDTLQEWERPWHAGLWS
jgi:hypothetical protein